MASVDALDRVSLVKSSSVAEICWRGRRGTRRNVDSLGRSLFLIFKLLVLSPRGTVFFSPGYHVFR